MKLLQICLQWISRVTKKLLKNEKTLSDSHFLPKTKHTKFFDVDEGPWKTHFDFKKLRNSKCRIVEKVLPPHFQMWFLELVVHIYLVSMHKSNQNWLVSLNTPYLEHFPVEKKNRVGWERVKITLLPIQHKITIFI